MKCIAKQFAEFVTPQPMEEFNAFKKGICELLLTLVEGLGELLQSSPTAIHSKILTLICDILNGFLTTEDGTTNTDCDFLHPSQCS